MLIITTIDKQPSDFKLVSQNMQTFEICGTTEQIGFDEVNDIPSGFHQRVLAGHYGEYLTLPEIVNFALIENGQLKDWLNTSDEMAISQHEVSVAQDGSILELYELIGGR